MLLRGCASAGGTVNRKSCGWRVEVARIRCSAAGWPTTHPQQAVTRISCHLRQHTVHFLSVFTEPSHVSSSGALPEALAACWAVNLWKSSLSCFWLYFCLTLELITSDLCYIKHFCSNWFPGCCNSLSVASENHGLITAGAHAGHLSTETPPPPPTTPKHTTHPNPECTGCFY